MKKKWGRNFKVGRKYEESLKKNKVSEMGRKSGWNVGRKEN